MSAVAPPPPNRPQRGRWALISCVGTALAVVATSTAIAATGGSPASPPTPGPAGTELTIPAVADTYVVREQPDRTFGDQSKITAASWPDWHTEAYVRFEVPVSARRIASARIEFTLERLDHQPTDPVELRAVSGPWDEATSYANRPTPGPVLATARLAQPGQRTLGFDLTRAVPDVGQHSFVLVNPNVRSVVSGFSREHGSDGPRLRLRYAPGTGSGTAGPSQPSTGGSSTGSPSTGQPTPSGAASSSPAPGGTTLCGASWRAESTGETYQEALARLDGYYDTMEILRVFYPGLPQSWPGKVNPSGRPMIVSFKAAPADVIAGRHDGTLRAWFAEAPRQVATYWSYYHEPEDNIRDGEFTAEQYRAAWRHLASLADQAANQNLHATLILMGWSLSPNSGRTWRDYYPGRDVIDVLGWDTYNPSWDAKTPSYQSPEKMFERSRQVSAEEGLPFGIAETGSPIIAGDDGRQRATWLRELARYLADQGAVWATYFDLDWTAEAQRDYRLRDPASQAAWREFCR